MSEAEREMSKTMVGDGSDERVQDELPRHAWHSTPGGPPDRSRHSPTKQASSTLLPRLRSDSPSMPLPICTAASAFLPPMYTPSTSSTYSSTSHRGSRKARRASWSTHPPTLPSRNVTSTTLPSYHRRHTAAEVSPTRHSITRLPFFLLHDLVDSTRKLPGPGDASKQGRTRHSRPTCFAAGFRVKFSTR